MCEYYMTGVDISDFTKTINKQNIELQERLDKIQSSHMVDSQNSGYQTVGLENYAFVNMLLFGLYYCIVIGIAYRLYSSVKYSQRVKIAIILVFAMYPYVINSIEIGVYNYIMYYYALITGTTGT